MLREKGFEDAWARGGDWREGAKKFRKNFSLFSTICRDYPAGRINAADAAAAKTVYVCFLPLFLHSSCGEDRMWGRVEKKGIGGFTGHIVFSTMSPRLTIPPPQKRTKKQGAKDQPPTFRGL